MLAESYVPIKEECTIRIKELAKVTVKWENITNRNLFAALIK